MLHLLTPENLAGVLASIGAILTALGGWALWKVQKEPAPPGTIDATREALVKNTAALTEMGGQFKDNNKLFSDVLVAMREMGQDMKAMREHLNVMRGRQ